MKLIIDVPEKVYQNAREDMLSGSELITNAIKNGTPIEQEPCEDCLFKKEWQKIGKLISVILEKQTEQEINGDYISREKTLEKFCDYVGAGMSMNDFDALYDIVAKMPSVQPKADYQVKPEIDRVKTELEDCISRQAVIEITAETGALETQVRVKALPPVTPQSPSCSPKPVITIDGIRYIAEEPRLKTVHKDGEVVIGGFREDKG